MSVVRSAWCAWCVVRNRDARWGQMEKASAKGGNSRWFKFGHSGALPGKSGYSVPVLATQ